jgi:Cys-rich repeat protein
MKCEALEPNGAPACVECTADADCAGFRCNTAVGKCVAEIPENNTAESCGVDHVNCLQIETVVVDGAAVPRFKFCLPGPVGNACAECRHDMDCAQGAFCLSGECTPCTRDKRCGMRCDTCGGDTPYCDGQSAATAQCVRCTEDSQCGEGSCDLSTHTCTKGCEQSCGPDTPYCNGGACVGCYADAQCPCGGTCNPSSKTCTPACKTNVDCLGNEHCRWTDDETTKECALGPMPDGVDCGGTLATICSARPGRHGGGAPGATFLALSILALWGRRTRRGQP